MSICPDKIVISEYVDGQLPSPWKEKLEQHIAECPKCKAELEKYKKLGAILKQPGIEETRDFDYDLSFKKLDAKLHDVKKHGSRTEEVKTHFWHKTIRLPAGCGGVGCFVFAAVYFFCCDVAKAANAVNRLSVVSSVKWRCACDECVPKAVGF